LRQTDRSNLQPLLIPILDHRSSATTLLSAAQQSHLKYAEVPVPLNKKLEPLVHPGRILRETVLPEAGFSVSEAALALGESDQTLHQILAEQAPLSAILCLKIARLFNSSPELWIRLQASYDLQQAVLDTTVAESLKSIVPVSPGAQPLSRDKLQMH
jgi:antitoxin HigA-1